MRGADPGRDLGQAEFQPGIAQEAREDLALLLGAQDRQERGGGPSIHYQKNALQFADSRVRVPGSRRGGLSLLREGTSEPDPAHAEPPRKTFRRALSARLQVCNPVTLRWEIRLPDRGAKRGANAGRLQATQGDAPDDRAGRCPVRRHPATFRHDLITSERRTVGSSILSLADNGEMVPRTSTPETSPPAPSSASSRCVILAVGTGGIGTETASAGPSGCPAWPTLNP